MKEAQQCDLDEECDLAALRVVARSLASALSKGSEFVATDLFPGWLGKERDTRLIFWYIMSLGNLNTYWVFDVIE